MSSGPEAGGLAATMLMDAVAAVAEESLFAWAEPCETEAFAESCDAEGGTPWLQAGVRFDGAIHGRLELTIPETLARDLCAAFSGADDGAVEPGAVVDFTGEIANIMCGAWLTRCRRTETFDLARPEVDTVSAEAAARREAGDLPVLLDGRPVRVRIEVRQDAGE